MRIPVLLVALLFSFPLHSFAQQRIDPELANRLQGKNRLYDVFTEVEKHYTEKARRIGTGDEKAMKNIERQRKFWNRWRIYWENRQLPDGSLPNLQSRLFNSTIQASSQQRMLAPDPSSGNWSLIGPGYTDNGATGRVSRIAFHPSNAAIIYIGTPNGGLWRTTNGGLSWEPLSSFAPTLGVSGIVISHNNPNTLYVLTGDGDSYSGGDLYSNGGFQQQWGYTERSIGVLKSTDGGQNWSRTGNFLMLNGDTLTDEDVYFGYRLVQDPANAQVLIAATSNGLFRTVDGGVSWTQCAAGAQPTRVIFDIEYHPGNSQVVYASGRGTGFFRSTDGGANFQQVAGSDLAFLNADVTRMEIAVSPANPNMVYLFAGPGRLDDDNNSNDTFIGMFRSTDAGVTFTRRANSPDLLGFDGLCCTFGHQSRYDMALAVKPTNANIVITGGLVMWKSTDGGVTYNEETDYFEDLNNSDWIHPDIHDIAYNPINPNVLYAATDGGIWVSNDDAYSWTSLNNGLSITQFYKMEAQSEDGWPWGGTQDNGTLWYSGSGTTFNKFDGADGYDVMTDIDLDDKFWITNEKIWTDGITDLNITPPGSSGFFPNLAKSYTNAELIYAGYQRTYQSYDQGSNWGSISFTAAGSTNYVAGNWALETCPSNNNRLFAAGFNDNNLSAFRRGIWRVDDLHLPLKTCTYLVGKPGFPSSYTKITGISVRPNNSNQVWITIGGFDAGNKVYFSGDAGENWQNVSGSLPNVPINCVEVTSGGSAIIGTDIGVFIRTPSMTDWTVYSNGLPRVPVSDIDIQILPGGITMLYAATFGRGMWKSLASFSCEIDLTINESSIGGLLHYQASNSITSTTDVVGGSGTNVKFQAGASIVFTPGFIATRGSEVEALIGPCNTGGVTQSRSAAGQETMVLQQESGITPYRRKLMQSPQSRRKTK